MRIYRLGQFFILKNRFSYLMMVALACFGIVSVLLIPKESTPEVQIPIGIVTTVLPGAPAADVEALVTNELERGLTGSLENVTSITSTSRESVSSIVVEFDERADIDKSIQDLKDRIDVLSPDLPTDAEDPRVSEVDFVNQPIMTVSVSGSLSDAVFTELMDDLETEIEGIPGVSRFETSGVRDREVTVIAKKNDLDRYDVSVTELSNAIRMANTVLPVGQIINDGIKYNIAFEGDIENTSDVANVVVTTRAGQPIYVRDVATIEDGLSDAVTLSRLSVDGAPSQPSATFDVYKQSGGDITRIAAAVNERLDELQEESELLEGVTVLTVLDSGDQIQKDLIRLTRSGVTTVVLVILLLVIAIGWREALVAGTAIPLSFLIGFIGLYLSGNTINFVSLFALILAIGILVDSGIVIVEGINRRMKENLDLNKRQAALETVEEFSTPLIAGTLTTVSMFSGLFLVSGVSGQFIGAIPFTINFILFASLLVALGFVPLIASSALKHRSRTSLERKQVEYAHKLESWYRTKISAVLNTSKYEKRFLAIIGIALVVALSFPITGVVKVVFFEQSDIDWIFAEVELPEGSVRSLTDRAARRIEDVLYQNDQIESFTTTVGQAGLYGPNQGAVNEKYASMFITLRSDRAKDSTEIVEDLRGAFGDIRDVKVTVGQPSDGPPTGSPLGFRFLGDDLQEITDVANQAAEILKGVEGTANVTTSTNSNSTEFVFELDRQKTAALGLNPTAVSQVLRTAVFGSDATSLTTLDTDIDVTVKLDLSDDGNATADRTNVTTLNALENISFKTQGGSTVFLGSLVDISLRESSNTIRHDDGRRAVSVSADTTSSGNVALINREFLNRIDSAQLLPSSVELEVGGETEESDQAFFEMFMALILGIVLMIAVLVLQFNSFRHTLYVLSILPFSLIGIMAGLALTQLPLSFPSIMGFIALSGIVVNNSILLIDLMNTNRRKYPDRSIQENVVNAAVSRIRPILLTTLTTVVGMIPLTYAADIWAPLAYAIMFGLSFSVIITLVLVPILYHRWPGKVEAKV